MISSDDLVNSINLMGIVFFPSSIKSNHADLLPPEIIFAELSMHEDVRMRLAIIAILLQRPDLASFAANAMAKISINYKNTFMVYYTAACLLQQIYADEWNKIFETYVPIPDKYSGDLNLSKKGTAEDRLRELSKRQAEITGMPLNWFGTFSHTGRRIIEWLKKQQSWAAT